jgi:hypothetical protein
MVVCVGQGCSAFKYCVGPQIENLQTQTRYWKVCIVLTVQYMAKNTKECHGKPASGSLITVRWTLVVPVTVRTGL